MSKILAPGLRIGWVNAAPAIVRRMAAHKSDHGSCPLMQRIVVQLLRNGKVDHHIETLRTVLRQHRDAMVKAIREHLPGARVRAPQGGYFLWVELPAEVDADELVRRAADKGVAIFSGRLSFAEASPGQYLRLAYSYSAPARIAEGIEKLGEACAVMQSQRFVSATIPV